ncbi:unnamed protein product [Adineta steineri]|uniref:Uncharacterized protein n=1 Tax=Adineta steineri TaxID=433720 RepID=A0A815J0T9_9BILA|nr:unnamed protein product [Adineta steineri]
MFLSIFLLFIYLAQSTTTTYDGIIRRSTDGTSYAYLSPPRLGNHAAFIEEIVSSHTLAVAWFSGGEGTPNCSIALSLLQFGSQQFTPGVIVSERVNYSLSMKMKLSLEMLIFYFILEEIFYIQ